jgi:hypothetical protein
LDRAIAAGEQKTTIPTPQIAALKRNAIEILLDLMFGARKKSAP